MNTLIIGGTGFIGRATARELLQRRHGVRVLSRSSPSKTSPEIEYFRGDIITAEGIAEAGNGCDTALLLAAREDVPWLPRRDRNGSEMFRVNVLGTHRTLTALRETGVKRVVVATSCLTFGIGKDGYPVDGNEPQGVLGLKSPYILSRIQQEHAALDTARHDFHVICAGPSAVVGADDDKFFGPLMKIVTKYRPIMYPRGGFNFIALEDVATGLVNLLEGRGGRTRYLFTAENLTYHKLLSIIMGEIGLSTPRFGVPPAVIRAGFGFANIIGRTVGRFPGLPEAVNVLNQRVYYDGSITAAEAGLPQTPVRQTIVEAVRRMKASRESSPSS